MGSGIVDIMYFLDRVLFSLFLGFSSAWSSHLWKRGVLHAPSVSEECHGKAYRICHKVPKHVEFDDCVDIIDTTYIDECILVPEIHCVEAHTHSHVHVFGSHIQTQDIFEPQCHKKPSREKCTRVPVEKVRTECKKVIETIFIEKCEDDSLLRGCIDVSVPY